MSTLAIIVLAFPIVVLVLMLLSIWTMTVVSRRMIGDKHHALQSIVETRQVPDAWRKPPAKNTDIPAERMDAMQQQAKSRYLQQLDGLIAYATRSTLVADEETRQTLLEQLAAVRAEWQAKPAQDL
jgi:hypothetical protein